MEKARITAPAVLERSPPHPFPLLATIAPVAVSVLIWAITRSSFALVFAALGPAVAVASVADARVQAKRRLRSERARFAREVEQVRDEIAAFHTAERRELDLDAPTARIRLERGAHDPDRWRAAIADATVTIGRGSRSSSLVFEVPPTRGEEAAVLAELAAASRRIDDAPVVVPAARGIAVIGAPVPAASVARGVILQLAALLAPSSTTLAVAAQIPEAQTREARWLIELPHGIAVDPQLRTGEMVFRGAGAEEAFVAIAADIDDVSSRAEVVVQLGEHPAIVRHPQRSECGPLDVEYVASEQATAWAARLSRLAKESTATERLPAVVPLGTLLPDGRGPDAALVAPLGLGVDGTVVVDLVKDGPHAVVGGTTGSGKSELLVAWVLSLAASYPPSAVTFLLVDFKGGAAFAMLEPLQHCVGVISDLDERSALRALESLRAEVRFRERTLAEARVRSIDELDGGLPRLVIVVDEFAAMVSDYPDLHALFADLASRGRSLGLHLVLCTQRPGAAVRDSVLANSGLRVSLRVNNAEDSRAVLGSDIAADAAATPSGRAFVSVAGQPPRAVQVALAGNDDAARVIARWPALDVPPRRPWRDPLPTVLSPGELGTGNGGLVFGLADHPHEQSQPVAAWLPASDGNLLVIGGSRSGKSTALRALGLPVLASDPEVAWDAMNDALAGIRRGAASGVLLVDDLDALVARYSDEHATAFLDLVASVLREGPARGVHVALATQRITPLLHSIAALCDQRLLLRMPTRHDHVLAGGSSEDFDPGGPPGRGTWRGHAVQVAYVEAPPRLAGERAVTELDLGAGAAVVSTSPRAFAQRAQALGASVVQLGSGIGLGELPSPPCVIVGDPDAWQSRWGALQLFNAEQPVFFDGCGVPDYRMLTRSRALPPPIITSAGAGWLVHPDGSVSRARLSVAAG